MTQVELPQISLQRYVELVKRRRWQLLPVSLLGLLVGAVVAFLIPRYYVAEAVIEHHQVREVRQRDEDPFAQIIDAAQDTIPHAIPRAMEELGWPEAMVADRAVRTLHEKELASRIAVYDPRSFDKERKYARITVQVRDRDGPRAAAMANKLVEVWVPEQVRNIRAPHLTDLQNINQELANTNVTQTGKLSQKRELEEAHGIRPDFDPNVQREVAKNARDQLTKDRETLQAKTLVRDTLRRQHKDEADRLAGLPARVEPDVQKLLADAAQNDPAVGKLVELTAYLTMSRENWAEGSPRRRSIDRQLAKLQETVMTTLQLEKGPDGLVPNPDHKKLVEQMAKTAEALAVAEGEVALLEARVAADASADARFAAGYEEWLKVSGEIEENKKRLAELRDRQRAVTDTLGRLDREQPITIQSRALPPPHPTDPNILVVALIGAVLGLGVAIGLILLLDVLQGTFKTPDEVERNLGLPVLGGVSHLETDEERVSTVRGRRRVTVAAFGFVALVVVVVTIYYQAPTRLPGVVRDLLKLLLGS